MPTTQQHAWYEDIQAILIGALLVALGVMFYAKATILTGGTSGLSLLTSYLTPWSFGMVFFVLNLPFYALAILRMGWVYTFKTFATVTLISALSRLLPMWIDLPEINPVFASIAGGVLMAVGMVTLFRHRAGLGGVTILAQYLQEKNIIRAGWLQMGVDLTILAAALFFLPWDRVGLSILGAVVLNLTLAINHKPGRYMGFS